MHFLILCILIKENQLTHMEPSDLILVLILTHTK